MDVMQWFAGSAFGEFVYTMLLAMVPVMELRGAIPIGVSMGLSPGLAFLAAVIGNMVPVPFILIFIRRIFKWMRLHIPRLGGLVDRLEAKAHIKGRKVTKYKYWGLMIFVAIPLPGTGAWTGALVAAFLDMRLKRAFPAIFAGVVVAGLLITGLTYGFLAVVLPKF